MINKRTKDINQLIAISFYDQHANALADNSYKIIDEPNEIKVVSVHDHASCAKEEVYVNQNETKRYYYVKRGCVGHLAGRFFNPYNNMLSVHQMRGYDTQSGRAYFEYAMVTEEIFQFYLKFLRTKNPAYLTTSERLYLDQ